MKASSRKFQDRNLVFRRLHYMIDRPTPVRVVNKMPAAAVTTDAIEESKAGNASKLTDLSILKQGLLF